MIALSGKWFPGLRVLAHYERSWWRDDILAGVVLTALLVPAGIGYAQVSGLAPVTGLYATIVPLLVYAVVGPSRILVLGPDSSLAPIVGASILPLAAGDPERAIALAGLLAILMGAFLVFGSLFRLGFVTDLLSKPIRIGYLNGLALVVIAGQLPGLLGFSVDADGLVGDARGVVSGIRDGLVDPTSAAIGLGSIAVIVALRVLHSRVPGVLVAVGGSMLLVAAAGWRDEVSVVGSLPSGVPAPALGGLTWGDVGSLVGPALGISLIAFADTGVLSRAVSARRGETVDGNDEMRALGISNVASGLFGGFSVSASMSRTPVAEQAGSRTQITGVTGAVLLVVFVLVAPDLTSYLPTSAVAAVVIVAASNFVDVPAVIDLLRREPIDGVLSLAALAGVAFIGVLEGIVVALGLSIVAFVNQAWRPYRAELGQIAGVRGYHDLSRHAEGRRIDDIAIIRFDAPLFFANAGIFAHFVRSVAHSDPAPRHVILAAEPITSIDSTAIDELVALDEHLARSGIDFVIAEMKGPVRDELARYGLSDRFGPDRFAPTVGAAVDAIVGHERDDIGNPSDRT
ncbi:MAG TPA: SulP family inorganic anion transporter [Ilumatobacteraceae bacterium]|nr:SulP family inorganic anion transporter [Ilumatobacteraceae bacterium]